jgi:putative ABC transport system permease protein
MTISIGYLARRELACRWVSALAASAIVAAAVAMVLLAEFLAVASENETRRIQRDIGLNIVILPPETDLDTWWIERIPRGTMPADWIDRLEEQDVANRLVPMLVARVDIGHGEALLTGIEEERFKRGVAMKEVFGRSIENGMVVLGHLVARSAGVSEGELIEIKNHLFTVSRILEPEGSEEDIRAWVSLADAQKVLGLSSRINEIRALECHCSEEVADPLAALRAELNPLVPGAKIVRMDALADARRQQRQLAERVLDIAAPASIFLAALIIVLLASMNVRERRREIGVLRAHGYRQGSIAGLFLLRAIVIGLIGGALGWFVAFSSGNRLISGLALEFEPGPLLAALILATICAVIASLAPAIVAAMADPARLMRLP